MNWLTNLPPGLKSIFAKKDESEGDSLWVKCPKTGELVYRQELESAYWVTPSGAHMRITPEQRFKYMFDGGLWTEIPMPPVMRDPLKFKDDKRYTDRLKAAKAKTGRDDCMIAAHGEINGRKAVILVQDFAFMGGSMGMAVGAAFVTGVETAIRERCGYVICTAAGGARMQEGILSLMQMPKTTVALRRLKAAGLPYIVVLTDPTTGGVTASYAMLGDVQIAEPGALIGFAGQRVIQDTIREKLPEGFQRAEYLLDHGMLDRVTHRKKLREELVTIIRLLTGQPPAIKGELSAPKAAEPVAAK